MFDMEGEDRAIVISIVIICVTFVIISTQVTSCEKEVSNRSKQSYVNGLNDAKILRNDGILTEEN